MRTGRFLSSLINKQPRTNTHGNEFFHSNRKLEKKRMKKKKSYRPLTKEENVWMAHAGGTVWLFKPKLETTANHVAWQRRGEAERVCLRRPTATNCSRSQLLTADAHWKSTTRKYLFFVCVCGGGRAGRGHCDTVHQIHKEMIRRGEIVFDALLLSANRTCTEALRGQWEQQSAANFCLWPRSSPS